MLQEICKTRRLWIIGKKITVYLDTGEFERIKEKFQLSRDLRFRIISWWQREKRFEYLRIAAAKLLSRKIYGPIKIRLGEYDYQDNEIHLFIDNFWLLSGVDNINDFIGRFCFTVAHEAKHSVDISNGTTIGAHLSSKEKARAFEEAANNFAAAHQEEFQKTFAFKIDKQGLS